MTNDTSRPNEYPRISRSWLDGTCDRLGARRGIDLYADAGARRAAANRFPAVPWTREMWYDIVAGIDAIVQRFEADTHTYMLVVPERGYRIPIDLREDADDPARRLAIVLAPFGINRYPNGSRTRPGLRNGLDVRLQRAVEATRHSGGLESFDAVDGEVFFTYYVEDGVVYSSFREIEVSGPVVTPAGELLPDNSVCTCLTQVRDEYVTGDDVVWSQLDEPGLEYLTELLPLYRGWALLTAYRDDRDARENVIANRELRERLHAAGLDVFAITTCRAAPRRRVERAYLVVCRRNCVPFRDTIIEEGRRAGQHAVVIGSHVHGAAIEPKTAATLATFADEAPLLATLEELFARYVRRTGVAVRFEGIETPAASGNALLGPRRMGFHWIGRMSRERRYGFRGAAILTNMMSRHDVGIICALAPDRAPSEASAAEDDARERSLADRLTRRGFAYSTIRGLVAATAESRGDVTFEVPLCLVADVNGRGDLWDVLLHQAAAFGQPAFFFVAAGTPAIEVVQLTPDGRHRSERYDVGSESVLGELVRGRPAAPLRVHPDALAGIIVPTQPTWYLRRSATERRTLELMPDRPWEAFLDGDA